MMILDCRLLELEQCAFLVMKPHQSLGGDGSFSDKRSDFYNRKSQGKEDSKDWRLRTVQATEAQMTRFKRGRVTEGQKAYGGCWHADFLCFVLDYIGNVPLGDIFDASFISTWKKTASCKKKIQGSGIWTPGRLSIQLRPLLWLVVTSELLWDS